MDKARKGEVWQTDMGIAGKNEEMNLVAGMLRDRFDMP